MPALSAFRAELAKHNEKKGSRPARTVREGHSVIKPARSRVVLALQCLHSCERAYSSEQGWYASDKALTTCPQCGRGSAQPLQGEKNCSVCLAGTIAAGSGS